MPRLPEEPAPSPSRRGIGAAEAPAASLSRDGRAEGLASSRGTDPSPPPQQGPGRGRVRHLSGARASLRGRGLRGGPGVAAANAAPAAAASGGRACPQTCTLISRPVSARGSCPQGCSFPGASRRIVISTAWWATGHGATFRTWLLPSLPSGRCSRAPLSPRFPSPPLPALQPPSWPPPLPPAVPPRPVGFRREQGLLLGGGPTEVWVFWTVAHDSVPV